ncbi:hypothetical protein HNR06_002600 [Nocardiopsis arvandica]|uniref:Uncharacterized protein n=1 Tax=Nocardiopsis sinuspersici TaxID=501010 RepID=A0A7Z0BJD9_9ACTN|nr:hypothetical protein [Nocardiopsis sinuspersici]
MEKQGRDPRFRPAANGVSRASFTLIFQRKAHGKVLPPDMSDN